VEIDEVVARVVHRYWPLLLIMTALPVLLVGAALRGATPDYTAATRVNASNNPQDALAGDSGISSVVSQVKAYATSQDVLADVIKEQKVDRRAAQAAAKVEVTGLGASTVVELTLRDRDPEVARKLAGALSAHVVRQINDSNTASLSAQLRKVDRQISDLNGRLSAASQRVADNPLSVTAANTKERLLGEISDLRADRNDLRTQLATAAQAKIVQQAVVTVRKSGWAVGAAIAGMTGLVAGILISVLIETFRPTVPGPQRVAKRLGVPLLGHTDQGPARLRDMGRRIRLAAKREGVAQVTLVGTGSGPLPPALVSTVAAAVYGDSGKVMATEPDLTPDHVPDQDRAAGAEDPHGDPPRTSPGGSGPSPNGSRDGSHDGFRDGSPDGRPETTAAPPGSPSTSLVRGGAAVMTKRTGEVRPATGPAATRQTHVHAFEDMDPGTDTEVVGVVAVAGPVTRLAALEAVRDLVAASGWPLLGVIATSRRIRG
jgi:capsular polysaccharide biosynthesis protein